MSKKGVVLLLSGTIITIVVVVSAAVVLNRHDITRSLERAALPQETDYQQIKGTSTPPTPAGTKAPKKPTTTAAPTLTNLPPAVNLAIPFTSQAPNGSWTEPYKEFCEEASSLMVARYVAGKPITGPEDAKAAMLAIKTFEEKEFGYWQDTTAAEVATVLQKHFGIKQVKVMVDPKVEDIKRAVAAGQSVIVPAAGRLLGNPFFTAPGPLYHMLVIKGYTAKGQFITHDPGTRRGADYLYNTSTIMNAMHDWRPDGNIEQGRKVILIVG